MQPTANQMHFFIGYAVAFLAFGLIGKWYVWPNIKDRALKAALTPLLLYACLRVRIDVSDARALSHRSSRALSPSRPLMVI
jgi:hypothetical protein